MIIDTLKNASKYYGLGERFEKGLKFLQSTDLNTLEVGKKYEIDGSNLHGKVSEITTISPDGEKMEAHKQHADIQCWINGTERIGHDTLSSQTLAKPYNEEKDVYFVNEAPSYFSTMKQGMFAIYFPDDLHMPGIMDNASARVKKIVLKVKL